MQKFDLEVFDCYFEPAWNCGLIQYAIDSGDNYYEGAEYVELDGTLCTSADSWISNSFSWTSVFDNSKKPALMPNEDFFGEEKKAIRETLQHWLDLHPQEWLKEQKAWNSQD